MHKINSDFWVGLSGCIAIIISAFFLNGPLFTPDQKFWVALASAGTPMILVTAWQNKKRGHMHSNPPSLNWSYVFFASIVEYVITCLFLAVLYWIFRHTPEYGFQRGPVFYARFFEGFEYVIWGVGILGFPYLLATYKWVPGAAEATGYRHLAASLVFCILHRKPSSGQSSSAITLNIFTKNFDEIRSDKTFFLGQLVKFFFIPIMLAFFQDQYNIFLKNTLYLQDCLNSRANLGWLDLFHVTVNGIFTVDVGLATCGYLLCFRWLNNHIRSVEPTLLGWVAALLCYPPFRILLGFYLLIPSEQSFLSLENSFWRFILGAFAVASYLIYLSATMSFGLRFSNLTNRGIISGGPYRWVRHPAYGAKNLAWVLVMAPAVFFQNDGSAISDSLFALLSICGMSFLYYVRAITEEKHLLMDPDYQKYFEKVKYRFLPGVW